MAFGKALLILDLNGSNTASELQLDISLKWPEERFCRQSDLPTRRGLLYGSCGLTQLLARSCLIQIALLHQLFLRREASISSVNAGSLFLFYQSRWRRKTRQIEVKHEDRECLHQLLNSPCSYNFSMVSPVSGFL